MIPLTPRIGKFIEPESRRVVARGGGEEEMGSYCLMDMEFMVGTMKKFW